MSPVLALCVLGGCRGTPERADPSPPEVVVNVPRAVTPAGAPPSGDRGDDAAPVPMVLPGLARGFAPVYPEISRRLEEQGTVELRLEVRSDGDVVSIAVAKSSGHRRLDDAALAAARTWVFNPRTGPYGVEVLHHRLVFRLQERG